MTDAMVLISEWHSDMSPVLSYQDGHEFFKRELVFMVRARSLDFGLQNLDFFNFRGRDLFKVSRTVVIILNRHDLF